MDGLEAAPFDFWHSLGVPGLFVAAVAFVVGLIIVMKKNGFFGAKEGGDNGAVLVAIGSLGELVREKTGNLGAQIGALEKKMDEHVAADVREFDRTRNSIGKIFEVQAEHGESLARLEAHREQWDGKAERRAR